MTLLIIGVCVAVVGLLCYFLWPLLSKLIKRERSKPKKEKTDKQVKKAEKKEKVSEKTQQKLEAGSGVVETAGDDFFEDPDTKVNYDNFDVGGYFEEDAKTQERGESPFVEDDDFSKNVDEMFEKYFSNEIRPSERDGFNLFENMDESDEELREFLEELNSGNVSNNKISEDFKNLSPEMKALMISNFLDRKDDI